MIILVQLVLTMELKRCLNIEQSKIEKEHPKKLTLQYPRDATKTYPLILFLHLIPERKNKIEITTRNVMAFEFMINKSQSNFC